MSNQELGVQKLTRSGLNGVSERDFWKTNLAYNHPMPKRRKLLAKRPCLQAKRFLFKNPFKLERVSFSTPESKIQKFRKGVGGQKGLARRNPSYARDWGLFSAPFFLSPLRRRGTHFWRTFWVCFGGLLVANPFSKPLKKRQKMTNLSAGSVPTRTPVQRPHA